MEIVADLHLHSKYSRAVSPQMVHSVMAAYATQKGLNLLSAADFTHPVWLKEIKTNLEEAGEGVYALKSQDKNSKTPKFILSTEIASIYKQGDRVRRIHSLMFAPNLVVVDKINAELIKRGCNLGSDGRPIVGLSARNLLEMILSLDEKCFIIPCHVWTPHFGVYGSASGFDSLEEAFGDLSKNIYAVETGLSSDPDMNWQIPELENRSIVSFSDAHSPAKMGREATVFELEELSYEAIREAIMQPMQMSIEQIAMSNEKNLSSKLHSPTSKILYTIEFYPEEGKYHFSGHRNCKISFGPEEIRQKGNICPVCHRKLTEGVLVRVQQLAHSDNLETAEKKTNNAGLQWYTDPTHKHPPFVKLVPLLEIIAESLKSTVSSVKVKALYDKLCPGLDSELNIILKTPIAEIEKAAGLRVAEGVKKVRGGDIVVVPGFDGEYGKVHIWESGKSSGSANSDKPPQLRIDF
ncbi:MAG TPA: endonuclease Q family protein [Patescibacteria group bacterium]|nr:endonuclease Q family protein [Patescibacteria group bacterium]